MFCVSVKPWLHSDTPICVPFSWTQWMLEVWRQSGALLKEHVPMNLTSDYGAQRVCPKDLHASGQMGLKPIYYSMHCTHIHDQ